MLLLADTLLPLLQSRPVAGKVVPGGRIIPKNWAGVPKRFSQILSTSAFFWANPSRVKKIRQKVTKRNLKECHIMISSLWMGAGKSLFCEK